MAIFYDSNINRRREQEDSYSYIELGLNHEATVKAMVVADGMGGMSGGRFFSDKAVKLWCEMLLKLLMSEDFRDCSLPTQIDSLYRFMQESFERINRILYPMGLDQGYKGGTTMTCAISFWDSVIVGNCGDSPAYLLKNGRISLISRIQNLAGELLRQGKTGVDGVLYKQNKNRLTQYLGRRESVEAYVTMINKDDMDGLIIGSDGAFGNLDIPALEDVFARVMIRQEILKELFGRARDLGEDDNQTAILYLKDMPSELNIFESHFMTEFTQTTETFYFSE